MNLTPLLTDNITEILIMIIEFTQARQKVLTHNITNLHSPGFTPKELEVGQFSEMLNNAVEEHSRTTRLVLCDTENIKFGLNSDFDARPVDDLSSRELLRQNPEEYIELQINKLRENSLNQTVAAELLRQKQCRVSAAV
jgi:flagellar basal body rod protein FlgB